MSTDLAEHLVAITLSGPDAEERSALLFTSGVDGVEVIDETTVRCFVTGGPDAIRSVSEEARRLGFSIQSQRNVPRENWVQSCDDLMAPLQVGALTVLPLRTFEEAPPTCPSGTIFVIPGMGFGTGHHAATRIALSLLQHPSLALRPPHRTLDVGTGSGILAMAAATLYGGSIDAIDNDPAAIGNARENIQASGLTPLIDARVGVLADLGGNYDVILANIYAEVLIELEPGMWERLNLGGLAILSGIMPHLLDRVLSVYTEPRWRLVTPHAEEEWRGVLLERQ